MESKSLYADAHMRDNVLPGEHGRRGVDQNDQDDLERTP
jgi:hypothetical protein